LWPFASAWPWLSSWPSPSPWLWASPPAAPSARAWEGRVRGPAVPPELGSASRARVHRTCVPSLPPCEDGRLAPALPCGRALASPPVEPRDRERVIPRDVVVLQRQAEQAAVQWPRASRSGVLEQVAGPETQRRQLARRQVASAVGEVAGHVAQDVGELQRLAE